MPIKIFHSFPGWTLSGVCSWSMKLMAHLDPEEFDQRVFITGQPDEHGEYQLPPADLPWVNLETPRFVERAVYQKRLLSFLSNQAPCVFLPNFDFDAASVCGLLPRNVAICAGIRSDDPIYHRYAKVFSHYWDAAVAVSRYLKETFAERYPGLHPLLHYIPNGVDLPVEIGWSEKDPRKIVYCNRIDQRQKRVFDVLAIARRLRNSGLSFSIDVLGAGPDERRFRESISREGLQDVVRMKGYQSHADTLAALERATFFLLPSAYEGMPNSLLEAMAAGTVPFAYDIRSGVPEVVEHGVNGYLFPVGDTAGLAGKLAGLLRNPEISRDFAKNARKTVQSRFSVVAMAESYGTLFRALGELAGDSACRQRDGKIRLLEPNTFLRRLRRKIRNTFSCRFERFSLPN